MITLESITPGLSLTGLDPTGIGSVIAVVPIADGAVQVLYKTPDGALKERLLNQGDEPNISIATTERPWSFDGDGEAFKLTVEAKRIDLAFLFDPMMAVHTSNVEPLPHQITAVYESLSIKTSNTSQYVKIKYIKRLCLFPYRAVLPFIALFCG